MKPLLIVTVLFTAGCFPLPQWYRNAFDGVVVDGQGRTIGNAAVVVCSTDGWERSPPARCPRRTTAHSDGAGRFHIAKHREWLWAWWFPNEPARPATFLAACADVQGKRLAAPFETIDTRAPGEKRVIVASSSEALPAACALSH